MDFREWLLLNEIPHAIFHMPVTMMMPDQRNEAIRVSFDLIDVRTELYLKGEPYKEANLVGFSAKFPFSNSCLVCYGPKFDSRKFRTHIGPAEDRLSKLPNDWYKYGQFMMGNQVVYWPYKGIYAPTDIAVTA